MASTSRVDLDHVGRLEVSPKASLRPPGPPGPPPPGRRRTGSCQLARLAGRRPQDLRRGIGAVLHFDRAGLIPSVRATSHYLEAQK